MTGEVDKFAGLEPEAKMGLIALLAGLRELRHFLIWTVASMVVLLVLTLGDPDMLDALISRVMRPEDDPR